MGHKIQQGYFLFPIEGVDVSVYLLADERGDRLCWVGLSGIAEAFGLDLKAEFTKAKGVAALQGRLLDVNTEQYVWLEALDEWLWQLSTVSKDSGPQGHGKFRRFREHAKRLLKAAVAEAMDEDLTGHWREALTGYLAGRCDTTLEEVLCYLGMEEANKTERRAVGRILAELGFDDARTRERDYVRLDLRSMKPGERWLIEKLPDGYCMKRLDREVQTMTVGDLVEMLVNAGYLIVPPKIAEALRGAAPDSAQRVDA